MKAFGDSRSGRANDPSHAARRECEFSSPSRWVVQTISAGWHCQRSLNCRMRGEIGCHWRSAGWHCRRRSHCRMKGEIGCHWRSLWAASVWGVNRHSPRCEFTQHRRVKALANGTRRSGLPRDWSRSTCWPLSTLAHAGSGSRPPLALPMPPGSHNKRSGSWTTRVPPTRLQ
jgi:hypothetical protein